MNHSSWVELIITMVSAAISYFAGHYVGSKKS